jgi:sorbitol/mannitol transport system permease protein
MMARAHLVRRRTIATAAAWGCGLVIFLPILWMFVTSFKTELEPVEIPPRFLMCGWTLENYSVVQQRSNYLRFVSNSILLSVSATFVSLLLIGDPAPLWIRCASATVHAESMAYSAIFAFCFDI